MRYLPVFLILYVMTSCGDRNTSSLPASLPADSVIPREEMIHVLADIHLVEAALQVQRNQHLSLAQVTTGYYEWLCSKYHISKKKLMGNLGYYKQDPEKLNKMYEEVVKELTDRAKNVPKLKKVNTLPSKRIPIVSGKLPVH
jgi:hypothetical protein